MAIQYSQRYRTSYKALKTFTRSITTIFAGWSKRINSLIQELEQDQNIHAFNKNYEKHSKFTDRASFFVKPCLT